MPLRARWTLPRVLLAIAAITVVVLGLGCLGLVYVLSLGDEFMPPSSDAAQPYVERYVDLLNAGDENGLRVLLGNASHPDDAARRIAAYRGLGLRDVQATISDDPLFPGALPWNVVIKARTSAGTTVTMHEDIDWTLEPSPHMAMQALSDRDGYLVGKWRMKGSEGDGLMRVRWAGKYGEMFMVDFGRFFDAPRKFAPVDSRWKTGGDPPAVIRYAPKSPSSPPDAILLDLLADSVTITDGRSGKTAILVRVSK